MSYLMSKEICWSTDYIPCKVKAVVLFLYSNLSCLFLWRICKFSLPKNELTEIEWLCHILIGLFVWWWVCWWGGGASINLLHCTEVNMSVIFLSVMDNSALRNGVTNFVHFVCVTNWRIFYNLCHFCISVFVIAGPN